MQKPNCKPNFGCFRQYQCRCLCAVSFGLGLCLASFCPYGLTLFMAAVILVALGISLLRH